MIDAGGHSRVGIATAVAGRGDALVLRPSAEWSDWGRVLVRVCKETVNSGGEHGTLCAAGCPARVAVARLAGTSD